MEQKGEAVSHELLIKAEDIARRLSRSDSVLYSSGGAIITTLVARVRELEAMAIDDETRELEVRERLILAEERLTIAQKVADAANWDSLARAGLTWDLTGQDLVTWMLANGWKRFADREYEPPEGLDSGHQRVQRLEDPLRDGGGREGVCAAHKLAPYRLVIELRALRDAAAQPGGEK